MLRNIAKENQANLDAEVLRRVAGKPTGTWKEVLEGLEKGRTAGGRRYYDVFADAYQIAHKYIWMYSTTVEHKYKVKCCWYSDRPCEAEESVEVRVWGELLVGLYQYRKKGAEVVSSFERQDDERLVRGEDYDSCGRFPDTAPGFSTGASGNHEISLKAESCGCGDHHKCVTWVHDERQLSIQKRVLIRKAERYAKAKFQGVNSKHHMFQVVLGQYILDNKGEIDLGPGPLQIFIGEAAGKGGDIEERLDCTSI